MVSRHENAASFEAAVELIGKIRGTKTASQKSLKWPVAGLEVTLDKNGREALMPVLQDVLRAGKVEPGALQLVDRPKPGDGLFNVRVTLAEKWEERS